MKKYIRVEDGIYAFVDFSVTENMRCLNHYGYRNKSGCGILGMLKDFKEYKQADTIEELVDEYVLREKANCKLDVNYDELTEDDVKLCLQDHDIFGAIWVNGDKEEPILKSVAKMNEKGDLELL